MKRAAGFVICLMTLSLFLAACGWKPSVSAVPLTAPWDQMKLPIKENAVVWGSSDKELKVVHQEDKKTVMGKYVDALKSQGWKLSDFDDKSGSNYFVDMSKGTDKLQLEIYDFEKTGVIIKKL